jgi:glycosyltransferase involved in cell wall biosynthesis
MRKPRETPVEKSRWIALLARALLGVHAMMMFTATLLGPRRKEIGEEGVDILLTGTFHSGNWILSHLRPLSLSRGCRRVRVVTHFPIPPLDKVEVIVPGARLSRLLGDVPARLLTFICVALRSRPHAVGGFHLLVNGLIASLLARAGGGRSIYFCVGGPAEVQGGGILSENRLFEKLRAPDLRVESMLLRGISEFDLVVTMGSRARAFFRERGVIGDVRVISGGIDADRFGSGSGPPVWDVVFVGRLAPIKQIDLLLRALAIVKREIPGIRAVIVGDGPQRQELETLAATLGLRDTVEFAGQRADVSPILGRSRVFVLTSKTEGLSLALMEAMMAGLPAVVSDVGDLGDLVRDRENGYLVGVQTPDSFAERIIAILKDRALCRKFSEAARFAARRHETRCVVRQWDEVLASWRVGQGEQCAE